MPCLFQRSNGIVYLVVTRGECRVWRSTGVRTRVEAEIIAHRDFSDLARSQRIPLFHEFWSEFLTYANVNLSSSTVKTYLRAMGSFEREIGDKRLDLYSVRDIEKFKAKRVGHVSPGTVNIEFRCLKAMFQTAVRWEFLERNPCMSVKQFRIHHRGARFFTRDQFQTLCDSVRAVWLRDLVMFAVMTMMRAGEIVSLKWDSIDLQLKVIRVENSREHLLKTRRPRVIPMNDRVYSLLSAQQTRSGFVFRFPDGSQLNVRYISGLLKRAIRIAHLPEELNFHSLRHTGASWLVQAGATLYEVQQLLGQTSATTTQIYAHLLASELHSTVNKIQVP